MPAKMVDPKMLIPVRHTINGISDNPVNAVGYIKCRIDFGSGYIPKATFLVIPTSVPVLLGMEFLSCPSVQSFSIYNDKLELNRTFKNRTVQQLVPLCLIAQQQPSDNASPSISPTSNALPDKLAWLKSELKVDLPEAHEDKAELESICDLILQYKDVFEPCHGTFPEPVPILTEPGKTVNVRQHPLPKQFHGELDKEIEKLIANDVIEPCLKPRGWNSPILAVRKKMASSGCVQTSRIL